MMEHNISFLDRFTSKESQPLKVHLLSILVLLLIIVALFWRVFFLGETLIDLAAHSNQLPWGANVSTYDDYSYSRRDVTDTYVTRDYFLVESYRKGELPLWNPYILGGHPIYADGVTKLFAPTNLLYLVFNVPLGYSLARLIELALACIFLYIFLINLRLNPAGALIGSIVFLLSDHVMQHLVWLGWLGGLMWLPLMLLGADKALYKHKMLPAIGAGIALALQFYCGYTPTAIYYVSALVGYYLLYPYLNNCIVDKLKELKYSVKYLVITLLVGFGLSTANWWPVFELLSYSNRKIVPTEIGYIWLPPWHLLTLILPRAFGRAFDSTIAKRFVDIGVSQDHIIYLGLVSLIFVAIICWRTKSQEIDKRIYYFAILAIGALIVMVSAPIYVHVTKYIPVLKTIRAVTRISGIYIFGSAVLVAYGADKFSKLDWLELKDFLKKIQHIGIFLLVSLLISLVGFNLLGRFLPNAKNFSGLKRLILRILISLNEHFYYKNIDLIIPIVIIFVLTITCWYYIKEKQTKKLQLIILLFCILITELIWQSNQYNKTFQSSLIYPKTDATDFVKNNIGLYRLVVTPAELGGKAEKFSGFKVISPPNTMLPYQINTIYGKDQLFPKWYREFISLSEPQEHLSHIVFEKTSSPLYDFLGVKYLMTRDKYNFNNLNYKEVHVSNGVKIYENTNVMPRAFFAKNVEKISDLSTTINKMKQTDFDFYSNIIVTDDKINITDIKSVETTDKIEITDYKNNQVMLNTSSNSKKLLVLTDTYYPGWQAFIDNKPADILRVDYALRGLIIDAGNHKIELIFHPKSFFYGLYISFISLIICVGLILFCYKKNM